MDRMFCKCKKLKDLNDIQFFITENVDVESFYEIFRGCSLKTLPDISQWNMIKAKDLSGMFKDCKNLTRLPDISIWKLKNVERMNEMFSGCEKLECLPDFTKWELDNLDYIDRMFCGCKTLRDENKFPDISKWKIKNPDDILKQRIFDE